MYFTPPSGDLLYPPSIYSWPGNEGSSVEAHFANNTSPRDLVARNLVLKEPVTSDDYFFFFEETLFEKRARNGCKYIVDDYYIVEKVRKKEVIERQRKYKFET